MINRTAKRGGAVVIPAFAVGRTQTIMYYLRELQEQQRIPVLPMYVDSPMAIDVTGLYASHHEDHDEEFSREESAGKRDPLNVREVHMTRAVEDSKKINDVVTPCIIVSASGMITGGRIVASSGAPLAGFTVLGLDCWISGGGFGRAGVAGSRAILAHPRRRSSCKSRDYRVDATFRARGTGASC